MTPEMRSLRAQIASNKRWREEPDRTAATETARAAAEARFEKLVDPTGALPAAERARRAENARREHYARMAFASVKARQARAGRRGGGGGGDAG